MALTDENGNKVEEYYYNAWGERKDPTNWINDDTRTDLIIDRGYTGHEHWEHFDLINMNGRVYDPELGRFLSPDPVYQSLSHTQVLNKYAYVINNPLKYIDPSGYSMADFIRDEFHRNSNSGGYTNWSWVNAANNLKYTRTDDLHTRMARNSYKYDENSSTGYVNGLGEEVSWDEVFNNFVLPNISYYSDGLQAQEDYERMVIHLALSTINNADGGLTASLDGVGMPNAQAGGDLYFKGMPPQQSPTWGTMYVISNVGPKAGLTDGHAWIRLESKSGKVTTMSLWGNRGSQEFWINLEANMGYGVYNKSTTITVNDFDRITTFNSNSSNIDWTPYNTCAGYSANLWNYITGESLSAVDNFSFTTPRKLSESIINNP